MKKCKKCGAPLEGFLYNTIGKLLGLKPSERDPEICNKCEVESETGVETKPTEPEIKPEAQDNEPTANPETEKSAEAETEKDDLIS